MQSGGFGAPKNNIQINKSNIISNARTYLSKLHNKINVLR